MDRTARLSLGQWFTPPEVARLALTLAGTVGRILDPACGDGAFLAAARTLGASAEQLFGVELDPTAAAACAARVPGATIHCGDLFDVTPDRLGFDAVVGNPPYVRTERMTAAQKQRIRACLDADWPDAPPRLLERLVGRGDLAAACVLRALRLAGPGARIALVVSSAMLHADYAASLWALVGRHGCVRALVDAPAERWFADAAVNALIVVIERGGTPAPVRVCRLRVPTAVAAERVRGPADLDAVADVRLVPADRPARWAAALRAEAAWFELERTAGDVLVPLSELADVRRGITSGANEVFYLSRERVRELEIERSLLMPLVRVPRERTDPCIAVDPDGTSHLVLSAPADPSALARHPGAARWLEAHAAAAERTMLRARSPWWALPIEPARLFLAKAYAARFVQRLAPRPIACDQRVYGVHPRAGVDAELLAAVLDSTFAALAIESLGRASMGQGALEQTVADAAALPVLDPRRLDPGGTRAARTALAAMARRPIGTVAAERDAADRARLDRAIAAAAPGVAALLPDVHAALIASVARRHQRARATTSSSTTTSSCADAGGGASSCAASAPCPASAPRR